MFTNLLPPFSVVFAAAMSTQHLNAATPCPAPAIALSVEPSLDPGPKPSPVELGLVKWNRDFDPAVRLAKDQQKPIFVLFSEVPGCSTCQNFGRDVMSHPLVVEAIESLFVPVAVYNNIEGKDRATLDSFKEPAWNNPVVRIVLYDRAMLADRLDGDYTLAGVTRAMVAALAAAKRPIPAYLSLLNEEEAARAGATEKAVFAVHCFWEGDQKMGAIPGVVGTRIGFLDGQEVVEVEFVPSKAAFSKLRAQVAQMGCATRIYARDDAQAASKPDSKADTLTIKRSAAAIRPDPVQKYHLSNSPFRHVPMTELQACRVNAAAAAGADPEKFLSPRQLELLASIRAHPDAAWPNAVGERDLLRAWGRAKDAMERVAGAPKE